VPSVTVHSELKVKHRARSFAALPLVFDPPTHSSRRTAGAAHNRRLFVGEISSHGSARRLAASRAHRDLLRLGRQLGRCQVRTLCANRVA